MTFEAMRFGPLGEAVDEAMPHSEADPIGVYAAALALFSSAISGGVTMDTGRPVLVWTVLVGRSALGRKGYALRSAGAALTPSIGSYLDLRTRSGVSSGPSLVNLLYELEQDTRATEKGADGRAMIVEEEWAGVLKIARRCQKFSALFRSAWDGSTISNRTKQSYEVVERPLLGFHAHITPGEWAKYISSSDALGGTYNRVLPVLVTKSKMLPYNHVPRFEENAALSSAYRWATAKPRVMSFTPDAGLRSDELRATIEERMAKLPEHVSCYLERSHEQIVRVAAVLTAAQKKTRITEAAVNAAWAFVQHSMISVEKLVTEAANPSGSAKVVKPLPDLIKEVLERFGGEASSTLMLRALGVRTNAAGLKAAVAAMDDVEMLRGDGSRNPGIKYRLVKPDAKGEKSESADVTPLTDVGAVPAPASPAKTSALDSPTPPRERAVASPKRKAAKRIAPAKRPINSMADLL
ncbi:DUF3987 domain-containing protein [Streptomyces decoyicus]